MDYFKNILCLIASLLLIVAGIQKINAVLITVSACFLTLVIIRDGFIRAIAKTLIYITIALYLINNVFFLGFIDDNFYLGKKKLLDENDQFASIIIYACFLLVYIVGIFIWLERKKKKILEATAQKELEIAAQKERGTAAQEELEAIILESDDTDIKIEILKF